MHGLFVVVNGLAWNKNDVVVNGLAWNKKEGPAPEVRAEREGIIITSRVRVRSERVSY